MTAPRTNEWHGPRRHAARHARARAKPLGRVSSVPRPRPPRGPAGPHWIHTDGEGVARASRARPGCPASRRGRTARPDRRSRRTAAVEALYARYSGPLYSLAYQVTGADRFAQDVVQEVFVAVWKDAARFDPAEGLGRAVAVQPGPAQGHRPRPPRGERAQAHRRRRPRVRGGARRRRPRGVAEPPARSGPRGDRPADRVAADRPRAGVLRRPHPCRGRRAPRASRSGPPRPASGRPCSTCATRSGRPCPSTRTSRTMPPGGPLTWTTSRCASWRPGPRSTTSTPPSASALDAHLDGLCADAGAWRPTSTTSSGELALVAPALRAAARHACRRARRGPRARPAASDPRRRGWRWWAHDGRGRCGPVRPARPGAACADGRPAASLGRPGAGGGARRAGGRPWGAEPSTAGPGRATNLALRDAQEQVQARQAAVTWPPTRRMSPSPCTPSRRARRRTRSSCSGRARAMPT